MIGRPEGGVRCYGIPAGFECSLLIEDLVAVSRGESGLAEQTRARLATLAHGVRIMVFDTPTCPHCPRASRLAHAMAQESRRVRADVIEAMEVPELAERHGVYGVPKTVVNGIAAFEGALPEAAFVGRVLAARPIPARA